jgi:hypothetical protein
MNFELKTFGRLLILLALTGFIASAILSFTIYNGLDRGAIPAISMLFVMVGMCFVWPTLLQGGDGSLSTMRVVVFSVTMVFVVIYTKLGWNAAFDEFKVDSTWISILGLAFGAKAVQHFSEANEQTEKAKAKQAPPIGGVPGAGGVPTPDKKKAEPADA